MLSETDDSISVLPIYDWCSVGGSTTGGRNSGASCRKTGLILVKKN